MSSAPRDSATSRISAASSVHSFNTRVMNVSHHVDKLIFSSLAETGRLRHVLPIEQRSTLLSNSFKMHQARQPRVTTHSAPLSVAHGTEVVAASRRVRVLSPRSRPGMEAEGARPPRTL